MDCYCLKKVLDSEVGKFATAVRKRDKTPRQKSLKFCGTWRGTEYVCCALETCTGGTC